ncbi:UDP-2-acetamido-2-deoxy-3-oxo-D-glucuronate aminotransferase [Roseibium album]|nr:UDP-2-acetamido-2-deoxy-3-oxo-D-glucuronate aminotransferase [Roseibium album]
MQNQDDTNISFVDLKAQQERIRPQIESAIARVFAHGQYIMGPEVLRLEQTLADYCDVSHAITCSSGTDALLVALMALGIGPGDAVLCPDFTYTATPEAIALLGGIPIFVDVEPDSFNLDPCEIEKGLQVAKLNGLQLKGLIAVDLFGLPAAYDRFEQRAKELGLFVICDAAQSFGASANGRKVGQFGDITTTSFFPAKPLGCYGDGGAVFSNNENLAETMRSIRLHGKARTGGKYDIERIGINGRLDTLQAAILLEKLTIFEIELKQRQHIADRYSKELSPKYIPPNDPQHVRCSWAQYTLRSNTADRDLILDGLKSHGVPAAIYYPKPLHLQPAFNSFPCTSTRMTVASSLAKTVFSIPAHPYLTQKQQTKVIEKLNWLADQESL